MEIGVLVNLRAQSDMAAEFQKIKDLALQCCQVCVWDPALYTKSNADALVRASEQTGVRISALWAGWSGPRVWDFYDGPLTLGLVPPAYRFQRLQELVAAGAFAHQAGIQNIVTHVGFLPEDPNHPDYGGVIAALRFLTRELARNEQWFLFETGQETPTTLVRAIEDIGTGNVGINFDTANVMLYGKANATDAARVFGRYVRDMHCKDGHFPTDGKNLGEEVPLGEGCADMPAVLRILCDAGYTGPLTIEREIEGDEQIRDITKARDLLKQWWGRAEGSAT